MGEEKVVNYFEVLGVSRSAAYNTIKDAYQRLSSENRDQKTPQDEFHRRQAELNAAYATLMRPMERWKHEAALAASDQLQGQEAQSKPKKGNGASIPGPRSRDTMRARSSSRPTQPAKADDSSVIARIEGLRVSQSAASLLDLYSIALEMGYLEDTRIAAGNALVDGYSNLGNAEMLFIICVNPLIPDAVREKAGMEAVGLYKTITIEKDGEGYGMEDMLLSVAREDSAHPAPKNVRICAGKAAVDTLLERNRAYRCAYVASNPVSDSGTGRVFPPEVCIYANVKMNEEDKRLVGLARNLNDKARFEMAVDALQRRLARKEDVARDKGAQQGSVFRPGNLPRNR